MWQGQQKLLDPMLVVSDMLINLKNVTHIYKGEENVIINFIGGGQTSVSRKKWLESFGVDENGKD